MAAVGPGVEQVEDLPGAVGVVAAIQVAGDLLELPGGVDLA
jgi:hypothetical protein